MLESVRKYIELNRLFSPEEKIVVGVSGGADSVALLAVLHRLGYACVAVHCNFHLRGEEADRDEVFTRLLAESLGVPFRHVDFQTKEYARQNRVSVEMAARELRYDWFEALRQQEGAGKIAVAHHMDDNAETQLLNMVRGTGIRGLRGMLPLQGHIVRPLLCVTRRQITDWLMEQGLDYVTDSTNVSEEYTRNFIRHRVMPLLEEINPSVTESMQRMAGHLEETEQIYHYFIEDVSRQVWVAPGKISIPVLRRFPATQTILYELLKPYGFNRFVVADIAGSLEKTSGRCFLSATHRLDKDRETLILSSLSGGDEQVYSLPEETGGCDVPVKLSWEKFVLHSDFCFCKDKQVAWFDYDKLSFPLTLRTWRQGDWFIPFGMKGRKKLSDYYSGHKYSRPDKDNQWLLCSGEDIIWIVGERTDNRFRVDEKTRNVLKVNFSAEK